MLYPPPSSAGPDLAVRGASTVAAVCGIVLLLHHAKRLRRPWLARLLRSPKLSAVQNMEGELSVRVYDLYRTHY